MLIFNEILYYINNIFIVICTLAFLPQIMYILFSFLKPKKFAKAVKHHKAAIVIPANNEEKAIADCVKSLIKQNYSRDSYDIYVVAHNCTDKTAEIAARLGAKIIVRDDPNERNAGYAMKAGIDYIMQNYPDEYEFFIRYDADGLVHPDAISAFNDAYESGVQVAKGYNNSKNLNATLVSGVSSIYFIRDNRFTCHVRGRKIGGQVLIGEQMMMSAQVLKDSGGWDCFTNVEDAEYGIKRMLDGVKIDYVPNAIVYNEHPTTIGDQSKRYTRIGRGLFRLFFRDGFKLLGKFFTTFKFRFLDMFLTQLFIPIAVIACTWFPFYYVYSIIYSWLAGDMAQVWSILITIGYVIVFGLILVFIVQGFIAVALERKRILQQNKKKIILSVLFQPIFMIVYAISILLGVFSFKPKWKKLARTQTDKEVLDFLRLDEVDDDGNYTPTLNTQYAEDGTVEAQTLELETDADTVNIDTVHILEDVQINEEPPHDAQIVSGNADNTIIKEADIAQQKDSQPIDTNISDELQDEAAADKL